MKSQISNEQLSDSFSTKQSEKIYPFCISLVSSSLKELENELNQKIENNKSKKNIIHSLFSLLNFQILLIQQISKYYNLYLYNSDEDNMKLIKQIININKDLINKKIDTIININNISKEREKEKKEIINEEKILNYKISKFNENIKNEIKINNNINKNENSFKKNRIKIKKRNELNKNNNNKNFKINENDNKEEIKNNSLLSNRNTNNEKNKLNLNGTYINNNYNSGKKKLTSGRNHPKRTSNSKKQNLVGSPYCRKNNDSEKIKIKLANKFLRNNDNNDYTTLSNLSRQSKKSIHNNLCLTQSTFNYKKTENICTIPVEENPVRKVKNIILNAKNSLLLIQTNKTPTNKSIFNRNNRNRYTSYDKNIKYCLSEDINKGYNIDSNKFFSYSNSSRNFYNKKINKEIVRSMSNKDFFTVERYNNKKKENKDNKDKNIDNNNSNLKNNNISNKERKCNQILKDGMKKIAKRLNSKEIKRGLYKNNSNDCLSLIKKITNKNFLK